MLQLASATVLLLQHSQLEHELKCCLTLTDQLFHTHSPCRFQSLPVAASAQQCCLRCLIHPRCPMQCRCVWKGFIAAFRTICTESNVAVSANFVIGLIFLFVCPCCIPVPLPNPMGVCCPRRCRVLACCVCPFSAPLHTSLRSLFGPHYHLEWA